VLAEGKEKKTGTRDKKEEWVQNVNKGKEK